MKKVLIILAVLLTSFAVFATTEETINYDYIDFAFHPTMTRYDGMGQSGLADVTRLDSFFSNPAALSQKGFAIALPSASFTLYNINSIVTDPAAANALAKLSDVDDLDTEELEDFAFALVGALGKGYNTVMKTDINAAIKLGNVGLGGNAQLKMHAFGEGSSVASQNLIPEVNLALSAAFGVKIIDSDFISLSAGGSVHSIYKAYLKKMNANTALSLMGEDADVKGILLWGTPAMAGSAVTFDAGATLGLIKDQLAISVTANNLNGVYKMNSYTSAGDLLNSISEGSVTAPTGHTAKESASFEIKTPWTLNFGFAFKPNMNIIHPTITADLVDMFAMVKNFSSETFKPTDLLLHLNAGAEIDILNLVKVRAGVNRGYMSVGAGLNFFVFGVDASYGWQEFGQELGDKTVDSFTIKFIVGYDK